jgi:hypothetical protein
MTGFGSTRTQKTQMQIECPERGSQVSMTAIEASACGDTTGVVAGGWEERCSERAASRTNN